MKMHLRLDRTMYGPQGGSRHLWVRLEVPRTSAPRPRLPLDLALVLDRSGSMAGEKITLAKKAAADAVQLLRDSDRCALVAYDDEILRAVRSAPVARAQRESLLRAIGTIDARGTTDLFGGWMAGAEEIAESGDGRLRRVLLLTDGIANVGVTDPDDIVRHVRELAARGVSTTTFGIGRDFDEILVSGMAEAGNGHFYYIERGQQIPDYLAGELGELLTIAAKSVTLALRVSPGVRIQNLNGLPMAGAIYQLGDLSEGAVIDLCFVLEVAPGSPGPVEVVAALAWEEAAEQAARSAQGDVTLSLGTDAECSAEAPDNEALALAVRSRAALARTEAIKLNRRGEYEQAKKVAGDEASILLALAGDLAEAREEAEKLQETGEEYAAPMDALASKHATYDAYMARRSRVDPLKPK